MSEETETFTNIRSNEKILTTENGHNNKTTKQKKFHPDFNPLHIWPYHPCIYIKDYKQILKETIAALIVSFAQVPESIAFALLAGVEPILGLHSAWMIGLIVHTCGGRPAMITGATGGIGAILTGFVAKLGVDKLPYILIVAGILIVLTALLGISKMVRLIPETVLIGFVNGLAIIIGGSQIHTFHKAHDSTELGIMIGLAIFTFIIIEFLPKLTTKIPSSIAGIGLCTVLEYLVVRMAFKKESPLIKSLGRIDGDLPKIVWLDPNWNVPPFTWDIFVEIIVPAILIMLVSITEDVMTMDVVAEKTETPQNSHTKQQLLAMGSANIIGGICGTMGGHATIPLSIINTHLGSNGYYRISGILASIFLLCIVLFASPLLQAIPAAALVGVMSVTVFHTFEWHSLLIVLFTFMPLKCRNSMNNCFESLRTHSKINRTDALCIIIVTILIVLTNLAYGVIAGILFSALAYAWQSSFDFNIIREIITIDLQGLETRKSVSMIKLSPKLNTNSNNEGMELQALKSDNNTNEFDKNNKVYVKTETVIYHFDGPLFFGNARNLASYFKVEEDPDRIEIHLKDSSIFDYSAIQALNSVAMKYKELGKDVHLMHINVKSHKLIKKAHHLTKHFTFDIEIETELDENTGVVELREPDHLNITHDIPV